MAVNYGQVAIVPKGVWNAETQYKVNNLVEYDGSSYVAKVQPPVGTLPTDTSYWQVSAAGTKKATADSLGTVMPDGTTTEIKEDGKLSAKTAQQNALGVVKGSDDIIVGEDGNLTVNTTFEQATEIANIIAGEAIKSVLGKVSKAIATTMSLDENALLKNMISGIDVNDGNKVPSSAYIHSLVERIGMGTALEGGFDNLTAGLNSVNNNLNNISYSWPVQFVGNGESLKTVVNKYCKSNTSQKYILNRIADSPFVYDGTTIITGPLTLDYSSGYWNNHPLYTLINDNHVYTGTINMSEWKVDTIVCQATKSDLYPSYNRSILFTDLKADVTNKSITITEDGLVQAVAKTQENAGTAFVRLAVNNTVVYEGHSVSGTYRYLWTPIFPVKKGDIIKVTLQTGTTDGQRFVYFYKS